MKQAVLILLGGGILAAVILFAGNTYNSDSVADGVGMHSMHVAIPDERTFIEHMIPHHQEAINTAQEVLDRGGTTASMADLAQNIITTQTEEVLLMKSSYEAWYGVPYEDTGEYEPMMRNLSSLEGAELDKIFLHDMTMHHMGAIMMARSVLPVAEHEAISNLADAIIINQTAEIETMRNIYKEIAQGEALDMPLNTIATIYKSPTCGCCVGYAEHLQGKGYTVKTEDTQELIAVKEKFGVPSSLESCHTMIIDGYVVEGHVPEEAVRKLLTERPNIKGIGMAGMPSGSPGMPGPKEVFEIYEINTDGTKGELFMIL